MYGFLIVSLSIASAEHTLVSDTVLLFECSPSVCQIEWQGDSVCDTSCMTPACNFDSKDRTAETWFVRAWTSDCMENCVTEGCDVDLLGDGQCDLSCNFAACGYDLGDCGYCAEECTLDLLTNSTPDEECNTAECMYDNNALGWCAAGCFIEDLKNEQCDDPCNSSSCNYDEGDCELTYCADGCSSDMVGDGTCDLNCFNEDCQNDLGDCDCSPGCTQEELELPCSGINDPCNTEACSFKAGQCGSCASGCFDSALDNGICDEACNTPACEYDGGACACTPGCATYYDKATAEWVNTLDCSASECMTTTCHYLFFDSGGCQDEAQIEYYFLYQLINQEPTEVPEESNCPCDQSELAAIVDAQSCSGFEHCNVEECMFCMGFGISDCSENCNYCDSAGTCLRCAHKQVFSTCLQEDEACPNAYEELNFQSGLNLCVPSPGTTWPDQPLQIYVVKDATEGDGSEANPFNSLAAALAAVSTEYTVINLSSGAHYLDSDYGTSPLQRSYPTIMKQVTIQGTGNPEIRLFDGNQVSFAVEGFDFILKDLTISGEEFLVEGCEEEYCMYCQYYFEANGIYYNDRDEVIEEDFPRNCDSFEDYVPFAIGSGSLQLENVLLKQIRFAPRAIIESYGDLTFTNVSFWKVQSHGDGSVIRLYEEASITYIGGSIEYLNDGYELETGEKLGQFFEGRGFKNAILRNLHIEYCITLEMDNASAQLALFSFFYFTGYIEVDSCTIANSICFYVFYVDVQSLVYSDLEIDEFFVSQAKGRTHFTLKDSSFVNLFSMKTMIDITVGEQLINFEFSGNQFENLVSYESTISFLNSVLLYDSQITGTTESTVVDGVRVEYTVPPYKIVFRDCTFQSVFFFTSLITISLLPNVELTNFEYLDSGRGEADLINQFVLNAFEGNSESYIELLVDTEDWPEFECTIGLEFKRVTNINIDQFTMSNIECNLDSSRRGGFVFDEVAGESNTLTNIYIYSMPVAGSEGYVIEASQSTTFLLRNATFIDITGSILSPVHFGETESVTFDQLTMRNLDGTTFSPISLDKVTIFVLTNSIVENTFNQHGNGGAFSYECKRTLTLACSVTITDSTFTSVSAPGGNGGVLILKSNSYTALVSLNMNRLVFTDCSARAGSTIYIEQNFAPNNGVISDLTISSCSASSSGAIHDDHFSGFVTYTNLHIFNNTGLYCGLQGTYFREGEQILDINSSVFEDNNCQFGINFFMQFALGWVSGSNLTFSRNIGAPFYLLSGNYNFSDFVFSENELGFEGYFFANIEVRDLQCEFQSRCANVEGDTVFTCNNCTFKHGSDTAVISKSSVLNLMDVVFQNNTSEENPAALQLLLSNAPSAIENCIFKDNYSGNYGTMACLAGNLSLTNCEMESNTGRDAEPAGLTYYMSYGFITGCTFKNQHAYRSTFIYGIGSDIYIYDSDFTDATSEAGAVINALVGLVHIEDSTFARLSSDDEGGAIHLESQIALVAKRTIFDDITAATGGAIFGTDTVIDFDEVTIRNCRSSAIHIEVSDNVTVANSVFEQNSGFVGGVLYLIQGLFISITNSTFRDNSASIKGGVFSLEALSNFDQVSTYSFTDCVFEDSVASFGGCLTADNAQLELTRTTISNSQATTEGGGLYLECTLRPDCYTYIQQSEFRGNQAGEAGGAIRWYDKYPQITDTIFEDNSAYYGSDIASFPTLVTLVSDRRLSSIELAPGQATTVAIQAQLLDQYGNVVLIDNESTAGLTTSNSMATLSGTTIATAVNGTFTFDNFVIGYTPNSNLTISVYSEAVDISLKTATEDDNEYIQEAPVELFLRDCVLGEENTGTQCLVCEPGYYSIEAGAPCEVCSDTAICLGNWTMYPQPTYWRPNKLTDTFYECPNPDACLGSEDFQNYLGECSKGYTGNMCQACDKDYSRSGENTCAKCPDDIENILNLLGLGVVLVGFCSFLVRSTLTSAHTPKALHSIYLKILTNYIQIVFLTTQFNLEWPDVVLELFSVQKSTAQVGDQVFSFDCYLGTSYDDDEYYQVYFDKLVIMSMLPFLVILISVVFWLVVAIRRKNYLVLRRELVTTLIVLLFFLHPSLTKVYFAMFSCREIEGSGLWLVENLDIECWAETHTAYALAVALPSLIVWGFGVPTLILGALYKNRRELLNLTNKVRFGFLFNGYKVSKFYWEFIIIFRKMLVICLAVFLSTISIPVQALTVMILLLLSLYLQGRYQPYSLVQLNRMETIAVLVASITIYCGLYFLTRDLSEEWKLALFLTMVSSNLAFLAYWLKHMFEHFFGILVMKVPFLRRKYNTADGFSNSLFVTNSMSQFSYKNEFGQSMYTLVRNTQIEAKRSHELDDILSFADLYWESMLTNANDISEDLVNSFKLE